MLVDEGFVVGELHGEPVARRERVRERVQPHDVLLDHPRLHGDRAGMRVVGVALGGALGVELAGRFQEETRHIRGTLAFTQLDYVATLWTRRKYEPNREHAIEVLADSWYHLLCDEPRPIEGP